LFLTDLCSCLKIDPRWLLFQIIILLIGALVFSVEVSSQETKLFEIFIFVLFSLFIFATILVIGKVVFRVIVTALSPYNRVNHNYRPVITTVGMTVPSGTK
jgi:hypothetical protein